MSETCPMCGASQRQRHEPALRTQPLAERGSAPEGRRIIVVGDSPTGYAAVDSCRRLDPDCRVTLVTEKKDRECSLFDEAHSVEILSDSRARRIDLDSNRLVLGGGVELAFDSLILAHGSSDSVPPFWRGDLGGVVLLRTVEDSLRLGTLCRPGLRCAVIGGGALGIEAAHAMAEYGARVTIYEEAPRLLPDELDERGGAILAELVERLGISIRTRTTIQALEGAGHVKALKPSRHATVEIDLVVVATASLPDTDWVIRSGIACDRGVIVDERMRTSAPNVYAAGSMAEHRGRFFTSPAGACAQAAIAAAGASGAGPGSAAFIATASLICAGVPLFSIGDIHDTDDGRTTNVMNDSVRKTYRKLVFRNGLPIGALLVNTRDGLAEVRELVEAGSRVEYLTPLALSTVSPVVEL